MFEMIGIPPQAFFGQLLLGLINGSFYAVLSLGLALIFGLLNIINFTHGAQYMLGAYVAWLSMSYAGVNYWQSLLIAPVVVGAFGILMERLFLRWLYKLDHLYGLLLTFGLALIIEGIFRQFFGISGQPYPIPPQLTAGGCMPRPRKLRAVSPRITAGIIKVSVTMRWLVKDGNKCTRIMRNPPDPTSRAATTKSSSRSERSLPRTCRARVHQDRSERMMVMKK